MAVQAVGLKTHIWNNNIKSMLFLLIYPILITATYLFLLGTFFFIIYLLLSGDEAVNDGSAFVFWKVYKYLALKYWYIPYIIISIFLLIVFYKHKDQLNVHPGYIAITRKKHRDLYETLENLCISRGLSMPFFFILKDRSCNAYSSGLSKHTYKIVLTYGLLQKLNKKEVE